jgi:hypothetical protein
MEEITGEDPDTTSEWDTEHIEGKMDTKNREVEHPLQYLYNIRYKKNYYTHC